MQLDLSQLRDRDFLISDVHIINQKPAYRTLQVRRRQVNGFLYLRGGSCRYSFDGGSFLLVPGSVVYLPTGSSHRLEVTEGELEFYRIDFQILVGDEPVYFSDHPQRFCQEAPQAFAEAAHMLAEQYSFVHNTIGKTALLATMLHALSEAATSPRSKRLAPAIHYLLEHLTEGMDCGTMAELCRLSTSQFYLLFREEFGMTPLQYRDTLVLRRADALLRGGLLTVTEIAQSLGFESVAYFSRFFKKHTGFSPTGYLSKENTSQG